ncbi:MAG: diguanylate cyclase domain protein [Rhizobium sp.]|nr:diguanylate cyclase domain protein [Rhizobium sp.]
MITRIWHWIIRRIAFGGLSQRRDVLVFAFHRTFWTTLAAVALDYGINHLFGRLGIFNISVPHKILANTIVTAFVAAPISLLGYYILGSTILDLAISRNEFERLSRTDPLTGLMNRRAFVEVISAMDGPYVLALFDIDRFKTINDTYGHSAGDDVLVQLSQMLRTAFGSQNAVARLGGEEFSVILKNTSKEKAVAAINGFREATAVRVFVADGVEIPVTISAGVSQGNGKSTYSTLLTNVDKALYLAKALGRNRVVDADDISASLPAKENNGERIAV